MNLSQIQSLADIATLFLTNPETGEALRDEEGTHVGISLYNKSLPSKGKVLQRKLVAFNACRDRALNLISATDKDADSKICEIEGAHFDRVIQAQAEWYNSLFVGSIGKLLIDDKPLTAENFSDALNRFDWLSAQVEAFLADSETFAKKPS